MSITADNPVDALYWDHFHSLALLALHYSAHLGYSDPARPTVPVLTLDTPHGQISYHVPGADTDTDLWGHVRWAETEAAVRAYDGHTPGDRDKRIRARCRAFPRVG